MADRERYIWEDSPSRVAAEAIAAARGIETSGGEVKEYAEAVVHIHNEGEGCAFVCFLFFYYKLGNSRARVNEKGLVKEKKTTSLL